MPMYILQRVNPGLYDLLQNTLLRAEELVAVATKTCEQMESELARGQDPFEDWVVLSRGRDWKTVIGSGGVDVVARQAERRCQPRGRTASPGSAGKPRGGEDQEPVRVVYDVTRAGWNVLMNRESCAEGAAPRRRGDAQDRRDLGLRPRRPPTGPCGCWAMRSCARSRPSPMRRSLAWAS